MPEGHSVHRIALQFTQDFVGNLIHASSPQGRFVAGAASIDGLRMLEAQAVGKQLFVLFERQKWVRIHLGIYGAWNFFGQVSPLNAESEPQLSIGAPRVNRSVRMAETEQRTEIPLEVFPPKPVGAVRLRLQTTRSVADLRGPTVCEVITFREVEAVWDRLGPDAARDAGDAAAEKFVARLRKKTTPVGQLLMDQSVISGIGNVYRAELLFRARLNPHLPGKNVTEEQAYALWEDWVQLLDVGIRTGQMITRKSDNADPSHNWVYGRAGLPCLFCHGTVVVELMASRKLYWCPSCQA